MNTRKQRILLLIIMLAFSLMPGCAGESPETQPPAPIITEPPTEAQTQLPTEEHTQPPTEQHTQPSTEEPTQPPTEPTDEEKLAAFQEMFSLEGDMTYVLSAGHAYGTAAEIDLYYLFYNGVNYPGSWDSIAESERELLMREDFWTEMDIQILPADLLEAQLQRYFGIGLADVTIPDGWAYSPDTDTYYSNHNDAYVCFATVTGWEDLPDGNVRLQLTVDMVHDHDFENVYWDAPMHMTLRPTAEGWQIVSNVLAEE